MNLRIYNADSSRSARVGKVKVNVNKSGLVCISHAACELMEVEAGDKIIIAEDIDAPGTWYIGKDESGIPCRKPNNEKQRILIFSLASVTKQILADQERRSVSFAIGTETREHEGTVLFPILTAA